MFADEVVQQPVSRRVRKLRADEAVRLHRCVDLLLQDEEQVCVRQYSGTRRRWSSRELAKAWKRSLKKRAMLSARSFTLLAPMSGPRISGQRGLQVKVTKRSGLPRPVPWRWR